jgi:predicted RNA binding protein YcfA (HicA-like mRNA interferase family)
MDRRTVLSTRELLVALKSIGFVEKKRVSSHLIVQHPDTGLILTLPTSVKHVPLVHLSAIRRQLLNYRIEVPKQVRAMLNLP